MLNPGVVGKNINNETADKFSWYYGGIRAHLTTTGGALATAESIISPIFYAGPTTGSLPAADGRLINLLIWLE